MAKSPKQAIKEAPVATLTTVESVVGFVLTFLVAHNVIGNIDVSATTQTVAPFIALVVPAIFGSAKWRLVSPTEKIKDLAERDGVISDADFARIDVMIEDRLGAALTHDSAPTGDLADFYPRHSSRPAGMAAGDTDRHLSLSVRR
jgi:hypothetical protein